MSRLSGPLGGNRVPALHAARKRPTDGRVGVGVSAAHDRVHHGFLQVSRTEGLPKGVSERRQNLALLVDVVGCRRDGGALGHRASYHRISYLRPACDLPIEVPGIALCTNGLGNHLDSVSRRLHVPARAREEHA